MHYDPVKLYGQEVFLRIAKPMRRRRNRAAWKRNSPLNRKDAVTLAVEMRAGKLMYFGTLYRFPL